MTDKISIMKITTLTQFIELASFGSIDYLTPLRSKSLGRLEWEDKERVGRRYIGRHLLWSIVD